MFSVMQCCWSKAIANVCMNIRSTLSPPQAMPFAVHSASSWGRECWPKLNVPYCSLKVTTHEGKGALSRDANSGQLTMSLYTKSITCT